MHDGPSDTDLVRRFQGGDRGAFQEIVLRYQHRVFTLCVRQLGEAAVAEEVAQDVFLALYRSLDGFRGDSKLSTFLFRIAVNHCKNRRLYHFRRARDRHEPLEGLPTEDGPERQLSDPEAPGTDRLVHWSEAEELVQQALARLDESHRMIIVLRDIEDLDYDEIGELLDLPRGTVKSRLHRARLDLARALARVVDPKDIV